MANTEDKKDFKFYVNNDNIFNKSKDKSVMKDFVKAFKEAGFKAKYVGAGSDSHSHPDKHGCTGENDVWCVVVGGDDAAMYREFAESKAYKKKLGKAHICLIRVYNSGGIHKKAKNINNLKKAHDDNYSKYKDGSVVIKGNLADFFNKVGFSWFEGKPSTIIEQIKNGEIEGKGLTALTGSATGSSTTKSTTWEEEFKKGYSTSNPFKAYLEIQYTVNYPFNHKSNPPVKTINVDFSLEAPEATNTNVINGKKIYPSFNNKIPSWANNTIRENSFNLLEHVKDAEGDFGATDTKIYYLYKVTFKSEFKDNVHQETIHDAETGKSKEITTNTTYDATHDDASYKMNLYGLGFYKGDIVTAKNMNSSGKKLNSVIEDVIKDTNCYSKMNYNQYRFADYIDFKEITKGTAPPVFDFYEMSHWDKDKNNIIVDGNIIGLSNVSYTPINDTLNNSIFIFKGRYDILSDDETMSYYYQRYCDLDRVLKYGEQTIMNSDTSNTSSNTEAYVTAKKNFFNNYDERRSYTIDVAGIPPVNINDFVRTHMINPNLDSGDDGLKVSSIEYKISPKESPVIQTTLGLGKPDKKFVIEDKRRVQQTKYKELDIGRNIKYESTFNMEDLL